MRNLLLQEIDETAYLNGCDTYLALCEYYLKQLSMANYYQEARTITAHVKGQRQSAPPQDGSTPNPAPQQNTNPNPVLQQNMNPDGEQGMSQNQMGGNPFINNPPEPNQFLVKIIDMLAKAVADFVQNIANNAAQKQNEQNENAIIELKQQATQSGTNLADPATADQIVEELSQSDEGTGKELNEKEKSLAKCILVGDFEKCLFLTPESLRMLDDTNVSLKNLIETINNSNDNPDKLANDITNRLYKDKAFVNLKMMYQQGVTNGQAFAVNGQMSYDQFRANEKAAISKMNESSKLLNTIDKQFKVSGGIRNLFANITKDKAAKSISQQAMGNLQYALKMFRAVLGGIMTDVKSIRKVNRGVVNKLRMNFGSAKSKVIFAGKNDGYSAQFLEPDENNKYMYQNYRGA